MAMERKRQRVPGSSDTVQEGATAVKHAKLVLKPPKFITAKLKGEEAEPQTASSTLEKLLDLETAENVLEHLLQLINSSRLATTLECHSTWGSEETGKCISIVGRLAKMYRGDISVCCVLVRVLEILAEKSKSSSEGQGSLPKNLQMFVLSLVDHEDPDVKVSVLKCLCKMVNQHSDQALFAEQIMELALRNVHSIHHGVRVECLNLIGQLCHVTDNYEPPLLVLEEHTKDPDPRVRGASFEALYQVHKKNTSILPLSVYYEASEALSDGSSDVRRKAVRLVWALGLQHPEKVVPLKRDSSVELRLVDDAFIKICDLVNDSSMPVRALSAGLLGDFHIVTDKFLQQTLDKKLMSHLKVVKSDHQRQREIHQGGGASMNWDSGRSWAASVPKMELDPGEISLMSAGACGAFVHGLEDEFMEVRSASVNSMCELSMRCKSFAAQSLDYLVDMFNDELEAIRLKAISSLCKISSTLELREDQLETVLAILEESSSVIRDGLRGLLSSCRITTSAGLNTAVHALLDNLKKYPHDCQSIWKCLQQLGANHGYLVSSLVPELLSTHPFFMGKEPDVDDPAYICILILVFNAALCCPTIPPLFPSHVFRHYTYLRDTLPHLIPSIKTGMPSALNPIHSKHSQGRSGARFLGQVLSRTQLSSSGSKSQGALLTSVADLLKMASLDKGMAASAKLASTFLQCQVLIYKVHELLSQDVLLASNSSSHRSLPTITSSIRELLLLSYRAEHAFTGLSPHLMVLCCLVRVAAQAMSLLLATHLDFDTEQSAVFVKMKQSFMERLQALNNFCQCHNVPFPALAAPILEMNLITVATETLTESLQPLTSAHFCTEIPLSDILDVKECEAEILEPQTCSREDFTKFVSSLALSVHVEASLCNVDDPATTAIQVKFADGRQLLFPTKPSEVRVTGACESRLDTSVILSHGIWTDPCQVEFCVVKKFSSDVPEGATCLPFDSFLRSNQKSSSSRGSARGQSTVVSVGSGGVGASSFPAIANPVHSQKEDSLEQPTCVVAISKVVRINVHPQEKLNNTFNVF